MDGFVKHLDLLRWLGFKGRPKAVRKPDGWTRTTGPYGEIVDADTLQCCHCGCHWEVVVGSGRLRGFCHRCLGYVCGRPECMAFCLPREQRLLNLEKGLPELALPTATVFGQLGGLSDLPTGPAVEPADRSGRGEP